MKWLSNVRIGTKLIIAFLIVAFICGVVGALGIINITSINEASLQLYSVNTQGITSVNNAMTAYQRIRFTTLKLATLSEGADEQEYTNTIEAYAQRVESSLAEYEVLIHTDEERQLFNRLTSQWEQYMIGIDSALYYYFGGFNTKAVDIIMNVGMKSGDSIEAAFDELVTQNQTEALRTNAQNSDLAAQSTLILVAIAAGAIVLAMLLGIIISRMISKPMRQLSAAADKLAAGDTDVTFSIKSKDEIGRLSSAFEKVVSSVKRLISDANALTEAAIAGQLSARANIDAHQGDYRRIIQGFNDTLDAVIAPVSEASEVLAEVSRGNLERIVTGNYAGDHAAIKESINETVGTLKRYIQEISTILTRMADGHFTAEITSEYFGEFVALKSAINTIIRSLSDTLHEISLSADQVASGTRQVSDGSQTISQGAAEQAGALEELSASITQIAAQTRQNAEDASRVDALSENAKKAAAAGNAQMADMQAAMTAISDSSSSIYKIIKVIDDIAFQTNILALNAAVEAARAGVHGRGFAVVADEVRSLAVRSASAAKETTGMIENAIRNVESGTKIADKTASALDEIFESIEGIAELIAGIAHASGEQATGIAQVNRGIEQLSAVVQTNSATAQQAAAASEELSSQAEILKNMVGRFKLLDTSNMLSEAEPELPAEVEMIAEPEIALEDNEFGKY